jgi:hypothetical protein
MNQLVSIYNQARTLFPGKMSEKHKPRRLAGASLPAAPRQKNPLHYFLDSPRRDFLDLEKGVSGGALLP